VRCRLWRKSNPAHDAAVREELVRELISARRAVRASKGDQAKTAEARGRVDAAKVSLGERGPVWWMMEIPISTGIWRRTPHTPTGSIAYDHDPISWNLSQSV